MQILMVSLADKDVRGLYEGEIASAAGESKHYYAVPYLPDAISENKTKVPLKGAQSSLLTSFRQQDYFNWSNYRLPERRAP